MTENRMTELQKDRQVYTFIASGQKQTAASDTHAFTDMNFLSILSYAASVSL